MHRDLREKNAALKDTPSRENIDAGIAGHVLSQMVNIPSLLLVMSIGNQKFGITRKYQNQIGIWFFYPKFLGIFLVFYRHFENVQC